MIEKLCHDLTMLAAITVASVCLMRISSGLVTAASRVKADIKQHSRGVKIIDNFANSLNQPTLPSDRMNDYTIQHELMMTEYKIGQKRSWL